MIKWEALQLSRYCATVAPAPAPPSRALCSRERACLDSSPPLPNAQQSLRALLVRAQEDWPSVLADLEGMRATLLAAPRVYNVTGDQESLAAAEDHVARFSDAIEGASTSPTLLCSALLCSALLCFALRAGRGDDSPNLICWWRRHRR